MSKRKKKDLSSNELTLFCTQLSLLVRGGISVYEGLMIMTENLDDAGMKELYEMISLDVEEGYALGAALEKAERFPDYFIEMIKIGETAGRLDEVLDSLAEYYEKSEYITKAVKNTLRYPLVMVGILILVMLLIITKALPIFSQVYEQLGVEVTGVLRGLLNFGAFLEQYFIGILIVIAVLVLLYVILRNTGWGRRTGASLYDKSVFTRRFSYRSSLSKFAYAVSLCLASGLNVDDSVMMARDLIESPKIKDKIEVVLESMQQGMSFAAALGKSGLFSAVYVSMISVGAKSGMLDEMMKMVADRYASDTDEWIGGRLAVIEPTIVIVMSVLIGLLLVTVMLPLLGILSSI